MLRHFDESKEVFRDELSECLKTKQKYQKFRFKILRYCENKMHKMLNENLAHKNGLLHVYDLYLDEFDWLHWSLRHTSILICTLVYISVIILFLKCLCYTSVFVIKMFLLISFENPGLEKRIWRSWI